MGSMMRRLIGASCIIMLSLLSLCSPCYASSCSYTDEFSGTTVHLPSSVLHFESYSISLCGGHACGKVDNASVCNGHSEALALSHPTPVSVNFNTAPYSVLLDDSVECKGGKKWSARVLLMCGNETQVPEVSYVHASDCSVTIDISLPLSFCASKHDKRAACYYSSTTGRYWDLSALGTLTYSDANNQITAQLCSGLSCRSQSGVGVCQVQSGSPYDLGFVSGSSWSTYSDTQVTVNFPNGYSSYCPSARTATATLVCSSSYSYAVIGSFSEPSPCVYSLVVYVPATTCQLQCPGGCYGHGTCYSYGCSCYSGFAGSGCTSCDTNYYNYPYCQYCLASSTCNGHGSCTGSGTCSCSYNYAGSNCNTCASNYYYYPYCYYCLASTTCNGHGTCDGYGSCSCSTGFTGANCNSCAAGYYNYPYCTPCTASTTCNSHGTCSGTGTCVCATGFTGTNCNSCSSNYYNYPSCTYCLASDTCSSHGSCLSSGACSCSAGFGGSSCSQCATNYFNYPTCKYCLASTTCNGNGACTTAGACACNSNHTGTLCDSCATNYYGYPSCNYCLASTTCNAHGACNGTGGCSCSSSFSGDFCDKCSANRYNYPTCKYCTASETCHGFGTCNATNGGCECDISHTGVDCGECATNYYNYPSCNYCLASDQCKGHGACNSTGGCTCTAQYMGDSCDQCAPGYAIYPTCTATSVPDPIRTLSLAMDFQSNELTAVWTALSYPSETGYLPILQYVIQYRARCSAEGSVFDQWTEVVVDPTTSSINFTFAFRHEYEVVVFATNANGNATTSLSAIHTPDAVLLPEILTLEPASVPTIGGYLTIAGINFGLSPSFTIDGFTCTPTQLDNSTYSCEILPGVGPNHNVSITTGGSTCDKYTTAATWSYVAPVVESATPISGLGGHLNLNGSNFGSTGNIPQVSINGANCVNCTITEQDAQISCEHCPGGSGGVNSLVVTIAEQSSETFIYAYAACDPVCKFGSCVATNLCQCDSGWGGPDCSQEAFCSSQPTAVSTAGNTCGVCATGICCHFKALISS